jgi:two-component system, cell cycle sensor histidine kinase and response regulator CckA
MRVLLVEDNPGDADVVYEALQEVESDAPDIVHVITLSAAIAALSADAFDAVLLDLSLPDSTGLGSLAVVCTMAPDTPVVVLTGLNDEATALKAVREGAQDYLVKGQIHGTLLVRALSYAIERKRVADALRESQARYQTIFERSRDGQFVSNADGRLVEVNQAAADLLGYAREDMLGMSAVSLYANAEQRHRVQEQLDRDGAVDETELDFVRSDGRRVNVLLSAAQWRAPDGRVVGYHKSFRDVTQRILDQQALRESEERFRQIAANIRELFWVCDAAFSRLIYVSPMFEEIWGISAEAAYAECRTMMDAVEPAYRPKVKETLERASAGEAGEVEFLIRRSDGESRWILTRAFPVRDEAGNVYRVVGTSDDVTARYIAASAVRSSEERLRAVLSMSPLPTVVVDSEYKVELWNRAAERAFGWTADEIIGKPYPLQQEDGGDVEVQDLFNQSLAGAALQGLEVRRRRRDGSLVTLQVWNALLPEGLSGSPSLVAILADVSEQRELEEQLRQAQRMEAVGRLAGGIAHDFNNLLTIIGGHIELILEDATLSAAVRTDVQEVSAGVRRAGDLTQQLLAFSRKQMLQPRALNLNDIVRGIERMLIRTIGAHIELVTSLDPQLATVSADPGRIEQVLMNLVLNAKDAMNAGGRLIIETKNVLLTEHDAAAHGALQPGAYAMLIVTDSGSGMDAATISHIFEPFFTTKEQGHGTGLGLATVYGIVRQSGGDVTVYSEPGLGSTFRVFLPAVALPAEPVPGGNSAAGAPLTRRGSETILLVEDEAGVRALVHKTLARLGYRVLAADSATEALYQCRLHSGPIDMLLTDVVMPGLGGGELAREITRIHPGIRVLFMSGYTAEGISHQGILRTGAAFLEKPFTLQGLTSKIEDVLEGHRPPG